MPTGIITPVRVNELLPRECFCMLCAQGVNLFAIRVVLSSCLRLISQCVIFFFKYAFFGALIDSKICSISSACLCLELQKTSSCSYKLITRFPDCISLVLIDLVGRIQVYRINYPIIFYQIGMYNPLNFTKQQD